MRRARPQGLSASWRSLITSGAHLLSFRGLVPWLLSLALLITIASAAPADPNQSLEQIDCAIVRKLTAIERWYWIKRLGLSEASIRAIKKHCNIK